MEKEPGSPKEGIDEINKIRRHASELQTLSKEIAEAAKLGKILELMEADPLSPESSELTQLFEDAISSAQSLDGYDRRHPNWLEQHNILMRSIEKIIDLGSKLKQRQNS